MRSLKNARQSGNKLMVEWVNRPNHNLPVEETWQNFIRSNGGQVISDKLGTSPNFYNADFLFTEDKIVLELKEIQTEFLDKKLKELQILLEKYKIDSFKTYEIENVPKEFVIEYTKLVKPAIDRILKKANKQIRETKAYYGINENSGILIFVNDGFTAMNFDLILSLIARTLTHSYSSIDAFILMTVNSYVALKNSPIPSLMWTPLYSDKVDKNLHIFVNDLGRKWREYIESLTGEFDVSYETDDGNFIQNSVYMKQILD